jgi:hypothetical protein
MMRRLLLTVAFVPLLVAPAAAEETEVAERLSCYDLDELVFHEELSAQHTDPELYDDSLQASWLGVLHAVGPRLRVPGHGVSGIDVEPIKVWSPEQGRVVLGVREDSVPESAELRSGVMVRFRFDPLEQQEVAASLENLMRRDRDPRVGPDLVVLVDGVPLGGSTLSPRLPTDEIAIPILDRTAFEVATYLSSVLRCERRGS